MKRLDCAKGESHNLNGSPPFYCPMKLNSNHTIFQGISRHHIVFVLALLMLVILGISSSQAQKTSQKRITSLQFGELAEGSRVSVFSDSALSDYEAFRRGDRFYVRIPLAEFTASQPNFRGDGFEDVQVQRSGDSILISFKLQLGANARVDQRSNRLDVIFSAPNSAANRVVRGSSANRSPSRVTTNAIPGVVALQNSHNQPKRNSDAAGPMPPDSPTANRPRVVTQEFGSTRPAPVQQLQSSNIPAGRHQGLANKVHNKTAVERPQAKPVALSPNANEVNSPPKSDSPSTFTPSSTPSYPTSTVVAQSTPWPSRTIANSPSATSSAGWKLRSELAMQWVAANRVAASVAAFIILSLVVFGVSMIFRKRRRHLKARRVKLPGVQPKNSNASDPEESMPNPDAVYDDTLFHDYVSDVRDPEITLPSAALNSSQSSTRHEWAEEVFRPEPATSTVSTVNERWITNPSIPSYTIKNEVPEREVFEL